MREGKRRKGTYWLHAIVCLNELNETAEMNGKYVTNKGKNGHRRKGKE